MLSQHKFWWYKMYTYIICDYDVSYRQRLKTGSRKNNTYIKGVFYKWFFGLILSSIIMAICEQKSI